MSILTGFKKVKRYIKTDTGYSKLSQWTSSQTVEMDDGTILENKIGSINETLDKKVDGVKGNAENSYRTGNVNITPANIGLGNVNNTADADKSVYSATKLTTSQSIDGVNFNGTSSITHYGTCSTAASTTAKTVSISNFALTTGARVEILFSNENTASSPTLNVNSTGALPIYYNNLPLTSTNAGILSGCCEFVNSGSYWRLVGNYTMVKGDNESSYRKNLINLTKDNIGLGNVPNVTTSNQTPTFSESSSRTNIASGETLSTILGKIKKWYTDLKTVAFTGSYNDLSNKPSIPAAVAVKGNEENYYRTGNVNLTPANIGAAPYSLVENGDFNNITTPGIYTMRNASANKPASGSYFGLIVLKSDNGNYAEQIAFQENSYNLYIRTLSSSTWTEWKKINDGVSGIKGNAESTYRTGQVNLTPANIGAYPSDSGTNAYNKANSAYVLATNAQAIGMNANSLAQSANILATGAYAQANAASNTAANAYIHANNAYDRANNAYTQANSAYSRANYTYKNTNYTSNATGLGYSSYNNGADSVAVGALSRANSSSTAVGYNSNAGQIGGYATAVGCNSTAYGNYSVSMGYFTWIGGTNGIGIGAYAHSAGDNSIAIGSSCTINSSSSVGIGANIHSDGTSTIIIGTSAYAYGNYSVAISGGTNFANYSIALGYAAQTSGNYGISIGYNSNAGYVGSAALGMSTTCSANNSTVIGYGASTSTANCIQLGSASYLSKLSSRVSLTVTSDERDKTDISDLEDGAVQFLNKIRTIRYVLNHRELYIDTDSMSEKDKEDRAKYGLCRYNKEEHAKGSKKGKRVRVGVSAQNTIEALKEVYGNSNYANIIDDNFFDLNPDEIPEDVENQLSANYEAFIPFLIKAVQEIDSRLTGLEKGN